MYSKIKEKKELKKKKYFSNLKKINIKFLKRMKNLINLINF